MSDTQENRKAEEVVKEVTITNEKPLPPDIFGRERIAEQMCQLIVDMKAEAISPLALDGKWGSGKSVHAERMKKCFEDKHADKIKCIYWNASAEDYSENPLLSFIAFLYQHIEKGEKKNFGANSIKVLSNGLFSGILNLANQASRKFVGIDAEELNDAIQSGMKKAEDASNDIVLTQFTNHLDGIAAESARLKAAEKLLLSVGGEKELIVIIDELDRCRPDFALKMLESIKYLFSTENCKFVLIMNKESMACSVEHLYGLKGKAATLYLEKYITRTFQLPRSFKQGFGKFNCTLEYFCHLMKRGVWSNPLVKEFINYLIYNKNASLRDIEKIVSTIQFMEAANKEPIDQDNDFRAFFICYIAYLFVLNQGLAMKIADKKASVSMVLDDLDWDTNPSKGYIGRTKPIYIEHLEPIIDFYFTADETEAKNEIMKKYTNWRLIRNIESYSLLFERWMGYCSFMR